MLSHLFGTYMAWPGQGFCKCQVVKLGGVSDCAISTTAVSYLNQVVLSTALFYLSTEHNVNCVVRKVEGLCLHSRRKRVCTGSMAIVGHSE